MLPPPDARISFELFFSRRILLMTLAADLPWDDTEEPQTLLQREIAADKISWASIVDAVKALKGMESKLRLGLEGPVQLSLESPAPEPEEANEKEPGPTVTAKGNPLTGEVIITALDAPRAAEGFTAEEIAKMFALAGRDVPRNAEGFTAAEIADPCTHTGPSFRNRG